jgi:hypothetical protein
MDETRHGPGSEEVRRGGLKHFSGGTKVWVLPPQWGDGWEDVFVVGRHRGSRRLVRMVMPLRYLSEFRVQAVYSPAVMREMEKPWDAERGRAQQWPSRELAAQTLAAHPWTCNRLRERSAPGDASA